MMVSNMKRDYSAYLPVILTVAALGGLLYLGTRPSKKAEAADRSKIPVESGLTGPLASITAGTVFVADVSAMITVHDPATKAPNSSFTALGPVSQVGVYQGSNAIVTARHNVSQEIVDVPVKTITSVSGVPVSPMIVSTGHTARYAG